MIRREPSNQLDWALSKTGCTTMMLMIRVMIYFWVKKEGSVCGRVSEWRKR